MPPKALARFGFVPAAASVASTSAPRLPSTPQESASLEPQFQRSSEYEIVKLVVRHKTSGKDIDVAKEASVDRLLGDKKQRLFVVLSVDALSNVIKELNAMNAGFETASSMSFPPVSKVTDESWIDDDKVLGMKCKTCLKAVDLGCADSKIGSWTEHRVKPKNKDQRRDVRTLRFKNSLLSFDNLIVQRRSDVT